jgi:hypothetical protein
MSRDFSQFLLALRWLPGLLTRINWNLFADKFEVAEEMMKPQLPRVS